MSIEESRTRIVIAGLEQEKTELHKGIIGQDEAVDAFANLAAQLKSGIRSTKPGPLDVKFLAGPSGVGKTELVLAFANLLAGNVKGREQVIVINGAEYQQEHAINRLFGSPPGYVGSHGTSNYIEPVLSTNNLNKHKIEFTDNTGKKRNVVIILIDEAEKANIALHYALLSVLDKGKMDMADNTSVDFSDAVVLYTSNVGNHEVEKYKHNHDNLAELSSADIVTAAYKDVYPPEYLGRINEVIVFKELTLEEVEIITRMKVKEVELVFRANGISLQLDLSDDALDWLVAKGYKPAEGVRSMAKVVNRHLLDQLRIANGGVSLDKKIIYVDVDKDTNGLAFYGNGNLPDAEAVMKQDAKPDTNEQIPDEIVQRLLVEFESVIQMDLKVMKSMSLDELWKLEFFKDIDLLSTSNIISHRRVALRHPAIVEKAKRLAITSAKTGGLRGYIDRLNAIKRLDVFDEEIIRQLNADKEITDFFAESLRQTLAGGLHNYVRSRNDLVNFNIGTMDDWDEMFKTERLELAKKGTKTA